MAQERPPTVSIGLPVFNGEAYVEAAIRSLLAQTYADFELVISDNASTDATPAICRRLAAEDPRIRFFAQPENRGAAANYNFVFHEARGRYFRWHAHDDLVAPEHLARCAEFLDENREYVLCATGVTLTDERGRELETQRLELAGESSSPAQRYSSSLFDFHPAYLFGLARHEALRQTNLIASFYRGDAILLAQIALLGCIKAIQEPMFYFRQHSAQSSRAHRDHIEYSGWFDLRLRSRLIFPWSRVFVELGRSFLRAPIGTREKIRCFRAFLKFAWWRRRRLKYEFRVALIGRHPLPWRRSAN